MPSIPWSGIPASLSAITIGTLSTPHSLLPCAPNELRRVCAVTRLRRGDVDALVQVLPRYQPRLYRFLLRMVHEPAVAEDLFQQTWVRVIEKISTYSNARSEFGTWLFSIARNLAIDHLRRKREWILESAEDDREAPMNRVEAVGPDPLERLLDSEREAIVAAALRELPAIHREVLALRFEEELKLEDIAQVAEIPLSTVKSRLHRALDGLRKQVAAEFPNGGAK